METIIIKLDNGVIGFTPELLKSATRKAYAHMSDDNWLRIEKVKDERFPPAKSKAEKPASD